MCYAIIVSLVCIAVLAVFWMVFWWPRRGKKKYFFFDPQDYVARDPGARDFPLSAASATFQPFLSQYVDVAKLLVTVAAASIAFGTDRQSSSLVRAGKLTLSWCIGFGVCFCALLLWRYDEYAQDVTSYTPAWYATIFSLGNASLICFIGGYVLWSLGLLLN